MKYFIFLLVCCSVFLLAINPVYAQNYQDSDQDNISDNVDQCPNEPENYNNYQDEDGCPDQIQQSNQIVDSDQDNIPDNVDQCVNEPENYNNYQDEDGCPDELPVKDSDNDGISDDNDQCPSLAEVYNEIDDQDGCPDESSQPSVMQETTSVPLWIKNNAKWWAEDTISENDFLKGIEWMISNDVIAIETTSTVDNTKISEPDKQVGQTESTPSVPDWIKKNAGWWASNLITEKDFVAGLEYLVKEKIIHVGTTDAFSPSEITEIHGKWTVLAAKGKEIGQVNHPAAMHVDSSNNLYVIDSENDRLLKFAPAKSEWSKVPISRSVEYLRDVKLNGKGDLFFLGKGWLGQCDSSGMCKEIKHCYRSEEDRHDYFCGMTAFVLDSKGNIFFTDRDYQEVNKYDFSTEREVNICNAAKSKDVNCINVADIAIDASDNIFISTSESKIYKFNTTTLKWSLIADEGKELGQVNNPHGLDIDKSGNLYVLDAGNGRIQKFIKNTSNWMEIKYTEIYLSSFEVCPHNISVDSSGFIYVSNFCENEIQKFTPSK